jgi:serine/threonine-protein kinase
VASSGTAERDVQAWLETVDADGATQRTAIDATIIPEGRRDASVKRAKDFLDQLAQRGMPVELRTGKLIGEGGMGLVHEAEQVALGRTVAVKTLKPGRGDQGGASDLLREAWITGALEHPNIVPVHHLEIDDRLEPLLILKRVDGEEWSKLFHDAETVKARFGATDLLAWNLGILNTVLNALRFAHSRRVIHRDLKPSNVMIGQFGEVYLLDWGIAASLDEDPTGRFPHVSESSDLAGTPSYMAPEMLGRSDAPALSERTDVYLAGAVLFELITGQPPHRGSNALAIISSVILSKPQLPSDTPPELAQICMTAMQPDPALRYASVEALQQALQSYLEHRGSLRLVSGAMAQLTELVDLAREADRTQREDLYRRLAICRYAFHEALAVWRDNSAAADGLSRAAIAVAEFELRCGDPSAAVTLLSELPERPALLAKAQAAADAEVKRRADADPRIDPRTRHVIGVLTAIFVILPLVAGFRPDMGLRTHTLAITWAGACLLIAMTLWLWASRKEMTAINRRVFDAGKMIFAAQLMLAIGVWRLGLPVGYTLTMNLFLWGSMCGMFAVHTDPWIGVSSVGYYLAFLAATQWPEYRQFIVAAGNACLSITVIVRWRPAARAVSR